MSYLTNDFTFGGMNDFNGSEYNGPVGKIYAGIGDPSTGRLDPLVTSFITALLNAGVVPGATVPVVKNVHNLRGDEYFLPSTPGKFGQPPTIDPKWAPLANYLYNVGGKFSQDGPPGGYVKPYGMVLGQILPIHAQIIDWLTHPTPDEKADIDAILSLDKQTKSGTYQIVGVTGPAGAGSQWDPSKAANPWRDIKANIVGLARFYPAYMRFPWPDPQDIWKLGFFRALGPAGFGNISAQSKFLSDVEIDNLLRSTVLTNIEGIEANIQAYLEKEALRKSKRGLISSITTGILGLAAIATMGPMAGGALAMVMGVRNQMNSARTAADLAVRSGEFQAGMIQAESLKKEEELRIQLDTFYNDFTPMMVAFGFPLDKWKTMTLDQKIAALDGIASGTIKPVTPPPVEEVPAKTQEIRGPVVTTPVEQMPTIGPPQPSPGSPEWIALIQSGGGIPTSGITIYTLVVNEKSVWSGEVKPTAAFIANYAKPGDTYSVLAPDPKGSRTNPMMIVSFGTVPQPSAPATGAAAQFDLIVEGNVVGSYVSIDDVSKAAASLTSPGDRFEIMVNGVSTGLRIRTATSAEEVPANMVAQVRALPAEQVKASVASSSESKGGFPWWIIAIPAAAAVALVHK